MKRSMKTSIKNRFHKLTSLFPAACAAGPALPGISLAAVLCLPRLLNLQGRELAVSNSWFSVLVWAALWLLLRRAEAVCRQDGKEGRGRAAAGLLAFFFSLCLAFGRELDSVGNVDFTDGLMWLSILVWTVVFTPLILAGWIGLEKSGESGQPPGSRPVGRLAGAVAWWEGLSAGKQAVLTAAFFLLSWLPVFLAVYPGFFVYDAQDELLQAQTRQFTTHHPLPHVVLLGGIILAVHKLTGSYNAGIAAYTLLQMAVLAGLFSCVISYMKKNGAALWLRAAGILYFALFPVIVMFSLCSAKDGIFSGALLLLLLAVLDMAKDREAFFSSRKGPLIFFSSALVMMSFRHNGMYALLVMAPILLAAMKGCRKRLGLLLAWVFAAWLLCSKGLGAALSAEDPGSQELLTVPIQQLARVYRYEKESLTEEQCRTLYEILPEEALARYNPKLSDGVKVDFQNEAFRSRPARYARLWLELAVSHPFTFVNAWLMTSYGFWYPDTVIDVYRGNSVFTYTYEDSSFFGYEVEQPGVRESRLPWLEECYRRMSLEITQQRIPVVSMLFSPGFLFWLYAFTAGYVFYRRKYSLMLPFALLLLVWLTVLLGPTCLPRYVLILWFALPVLPGLLLSAPSRGTASGPGL
ncbi:MAG: DUF6020 family protein [Lachnospiraceae bacterium]|nr:DUF6020 family protein [Lachnospiraceae bacterium]